MSRKSNRVWVISVKRKTEVMVALCSLCKGSELATNLCYLYLAIFSIWYPLQVYGFTSECGM